MTRTMYDSVTAGDIPLSATMVAGYDDGIYAWSAADWHRFANAVQVHIAITAAANSSQVLDVETGDATPAQAPGWVLMRRAAGADPTVYMNASTWPAVRSAFASQHVAEPHYWVAAYDNVAQIPDGAVAKQYIDPPKSGGHYDLSIVADYWPGVDAPAPITYDPSEDSPMIATRPDRSAVDYFSIDSSSDLRTGSVASNGTVTASYVPAPYAGHPIAMILGASWATGCLVVQVKGTDGNEYIARFVQNAWQDYVGA